MSVNVLQQLSRYTTIVADTGDLAAIARLRPQDATTNPALITAAVLQPEHRALVADYVQQSNLLRLNNTERVEWVIDQLTVALGLRISALIAGRVSTEVDARLSYDTEATIAKARDLMAMYQAAGVRRERVLIKIAATWEGIQAARVLEQEGIHCNLTLLFGIHQARACAEAGVTLISPFVGRILDWQKKHEGRESIPVAQDMGVQSVKQIFAYYKQHGYATEVMGASFRSTAQIEALAGCDLLTISPALLDQLAASNASLERQLDASSIDKIEARPAAMTQVQFIAAHEADPMSSQLLDAGIQGFVGAREQLFEQLKRVS
jgi:transaldolase